jgi:hypothetical protein
MKLLHIKKREIQYLKRSLFWKHHGMTMSMFGCSKTHPSVGID